MKRNLALAAILFGLAVFVCLVLVSCGTPVTFSGGYVSETGQHYDASVGFVIPDKKGLKK